MYVHALVFNTGSSIMVFTSNQVLKDDFPTNFYRHKMVRTKKLSRKQKECHDARTEVPSEHWEVLQTIVYALIL